MKTKRTVKTTTLDLIIKKKTTTLHVQPTFLLLISKKTTLHVQHTFVYISLSLLCTTKTCKNFLGGFSLPSVTNPSLPCVGGLGGFSLEMFSRMFLNFNNGNLTTLKQGIDFYINKL